MTWQSMRAASRLMVSMRLDLTTQGIDRIPTTGPVIVAARHYHHLYDGCALLATIPRPLSILVALDWAKQPVLNRAMTRLCGAADWPIVARRGRTTAGDGIGERGLRAATRESLALLAAGRILIVFPEGYPNVDPGYTPKTGPEAFLPFEPGVVRLARMAARRGVNAPIVPAGFAYQPGGRWRVNLAFGEPVMIPDRSSDAAALNELETAVHRLSAFPANR